MKTYTLICLVGLLLGSTALTEALASPRRAPNIVIIYMDDLGWKDLGCYGSQFYQTPNIDQLAADGVRFTRAYSPSPLCAPSRGAVLSGKYPGRTKFTSIMSGGADDSLFTQSKALGLGNRNLEASHRQVLPSTETLFAERFQDAGYATCFLGKWHAGRNPGYHPRDRGYDEWYAVRKAGGYPYYLTEEAIDSLEHVPGADPGDYLPELMTNWANDFMERQVEKGRPFLLHICYFLVHTPIVAKKELEETYQKRRDLIQTDQDNVAYATMVQAMDQEVGRIVAKLEALGQLENTLILFTSDNGGYTGREITSNYPLMGGKSFSFEGAYRVPFIAMWKGRIAPGQVNDTRIVGMDIYPTLLEAAGLPLDPGQHADGMSLFGEFIGEAEGSRLSERPLYFHHPHYTHASSPHSILIEDDYKLIRYYNDEAGGFALFNLDEDPAEQNDLATAQPDRVTQMKQKLESFLHATGAELPVPADSLEGKRILKLHAQGKNPGWSARYQDYDEVMNKATERELALKERAIQEQKLKQ